MKAYQRKTVIGFLLVILPLVIWAQQRRISNNNKYIDDLHTYIKTLENHVPTFIELQEMLTYLGYDLGPKGIDGDIGTDTKKAWEEAICNQAAAKYFRKVVR